MEHVPPKAPREPDGKDASSPEPPADSHLDEELDEALDETFPASDPVPWSHGDR